MNEIQIIQSQLATERLHFAEVADACAAALDTGTFAARREFAAACADYFAFAATRLAWSSSPPGPDASAERWREFLRACKDQAATHFGALEQLLGRNLPVSEWRAISRIDADSIFTERACYARVKATVP
ncbi:MAG: hypothetical protein ACJ8R9_13445 [Steroidobacteraceae bacterium]